jgi:hypothetical protein
MLDKNADVTNDDIFAMLAGELLPSDIHARRALRKMERQCGVLQNKFEIELDKLSTRALIRGMRSESVYFWNYHEGEYDFGYPRQSMPMNADETYLTFRARMFAYRKLLTQRPHVPNKPEGHAARRMAATAHHGPKKAGGRAKAWGVRHSRA